MFPSFLLIRSGGRALLNSFRTLTPPVLSLRPCPDILISGDHLLAIFQRRAMKDLSADQISSHLVLGLWRRSQPFLSRGSKDCLMYLYYDRKVLRIESSITAACNWAHGTKTKAKGLHAFHILFGGLRSTRSILPSSILYC